MILTHKLAYYLQETPQEGNIVCPFLKCCVKERQCSFHVGGIASVAFIFPIRSSFQPGYCMHQSDRFGYSDKYVPSSSIAGELGRTVWLALAGILSLIMGTDLQTEFIAG